MRKYQVSFIWSGFGVSTGRKREGKNMGKFLWILWGLAFLMAGCEERDFHLKIVYQQVHGLRKGDRVLFEENHVGNVEQVSYAANGAYEVTVALKPDFQNAATNATAFHIIPDPQAPEQQAIEMVLMQSGGVRLKQGETVKGAVKPPTPPSEVWTELERGMEDLKKGFEKFAKELGKIPESEELKKLQKEMDHLSEDLKKSGREARAKIQKEILPRLKKEMEKLRMWLRELGREKELKPLEIQMEKLRRI